MLSVSNLSIQFGKRVLFDNVNTSFNNGNCYGIIGANGAGKSTFLKILSGKIDPTSGNVHLEPGKRMSVLEQDHSLFDSNSVLETVIMGDISLYQIKKEIDSLYENYSDENAEKIGSLQVKFEEMDGWNAESNAASLLSNLGIKESLHQTKMNDIDPKLKVRILLAKALFIFGKVCNTTLPEPRLIWPTSEFPTWPMGKPTSSPEASRVEYGNVLVK